MDETARRRDNKHFANRRYPTSRAGMGLGQGGRQSLRPGGQPHTGPLRSTTQALPAGQSASVVQMGQVGLAEHLGLLQSMLTVVTQTALPCVPRSQMHPFSGVLHCTGAP